MWQNICKKFGLIVLSIGKFDKTYLVGFDYFFGEMDDLSKFQPVDFSRLPLISYMYSINVILR